MAMSNSVVARFDTHQAAEGAVRKLIAEDFEMGGLSVVGRGFHSEEKIIGFYNTGDRIRFWGTRGAFWGGLWGMFLGGLFVTVPVAGPVVVLGYLAGVAAATIESAALVGGLSTIGTALASIGVPKDSVVEYETEVAADGFLVMAHGLPDDMERSKRILGTSRPSRITMHRDPAASTPADEIQVA